MVTTIFLFFIFLLAKFYDKKKGLPQLQSMFLRKKNPQFHHIFSKKQMLSLPYLDYSSLQVTIHTKVSKEYYLSTYL
jgi:hypothetical protein